MGSLRTPHLPTMFGLGRLLGRSTDRQAQSRAEPAIRGQCSMAYPPVDPGLPNLAVDEILEQNHDVIARIKLAYGADSPSFAADLLPLIRRYAEYVHLLPATADNYFCSPGGLFRLGILVAFYALQSTDSQIFSGAATILKRKDLEPRWRKATFIAGLCNELHRTLSHIVVTDSAGHEWPSYISPLSAWITRVGADRYYVKWIANASEMRSLGVFAVPHIVDPKTVQDLADGNAVVVPQMMGCISGMPSHREHGALEQLVRRSAALVIDSDLKASSDRYGRPILGSHLERYLLDAMRRLVASSDAWKPNGEKSRVWYGADGVFLVWPNAATDIAKLLEGDLLPGIPKSSETILEILVAAKVVVPKSEQCGTWDIYPADGKKELTAVRLSSPDVLFAGLSSQPTMLERSLATAGRAAEAAPAQVAPARPDVGAHATQSRATEHEVACPSLFDGVPACGLPEPTKEVAASDETSNTGGKQAVVVSTPPEFKLKAPVRLNPQVRQALESIVASMNRDASTILARTVPTGVFVPLASFKELRIDTAIAVRGLAEVGMLAVSANSRSKTVIQEFNSSDVTGVVVLPEYVEGLSASDFVSATADGKR